MAGEDWKSFVRIATLGGAAQLFVRSVPADDRVLLAGWNWTKVLISSYHCLFWICQGQQYFPPKYLSTYFKSDGGRFRFSRLASPGLPSAHSNVWLHLRNLDGAIGHATLNPQGDHSRTQLVLTTQSLNIIWTSSQEKHHKVLHIFSFQKSHYCIIYFTSSAIRMQQCAVSEVLGRPRYDWSEQLKATGGPKLALGGTLAPATHTLESVGHTVSYTVRATLSNAATLHQSPPSKHGTHLCVWIIEINFDHPPC